MVQEQVHQDIRKKYGINKIFRYIREINEIEDKICSQNLVQEWLILHLNLEQLDFTKEFRNNAFVYYLETYGIISEKINLLIPEASELDSLLFCHEELTETREVELVDEFARLLYVFNTLKSKDEDKSNIKNDPFVKFLIPMSVNENTLTFISENISFYNFFYKWNLFILSRKKEIK